MNLRKQRQRRLRQQIERLERREAGLQRESDRLTRWRLISFALVFVVGAAVLLTWGAVAWAVASLLVLIPFIVAVGRHRRVDVSRTRHRLYRELKETQLARLTLDWDRIPPAQPVPPRLDHPFALDIDLIGERSLHQLLDTAVSQEGSERLRAWLLATDPDPEQTVARQALVRELEGMVRFRERLVLQARLAAADDGQKWPGNRLLTWLQQDAGAAVSRAVLLVLLLLVPINLALLLLNLLGVLPPLWLVSWLLYAVLTVSQAGRVGPLFADAAFMQSSLEQLEAVFGFLEQDRYGRHPRVRALCAPFLDAAQRPSAQLRRVRRVVAAAGLRYNPLVAFLLNALVPLDVAAAAWLATLKRDLGALLPQWLDVWFELEALGALANYAYLNPETHYPQVKTAVSSPVFAARALGHPLIPAAERVCNDFTLDELGSLAIITGSNMAGKSSFLRTLGVNVTLALAGGPVVAQAMELAPLRLYASIRVTDSVTDGFSFFYAEVRRLRALLAELRRRDAWPLFFLIDEIFRGTNNRERLIGSRSYVRALAGGHGTGAIATHDLELVRLAEESPQIRNMHFRDAVENGRMVFDYTLRPGPCPTTNALKIMRLAGLPVETGELETGD